MALNPKQQRFADEYLVDQNATKAAIRAGYKKSTAKNACYWINKEADEKQARTGRKPQYKPETAAYIKEQLERIHNENTADAQEVLEYLTAVMRGKHTEQTLRLVGDGMQEITDIEVAAKERLKAAELLGKVHMMFTDKVEQQVDMDLNITVDYGDDG